MKYTILEGIATADVAYKIYGKNLSELFKNAALAVEQTMVDLATLAPLQNLEFRVKNLELEDLLLDFLNHLIFLKDARQLVFSKFDLHLKKEDYFQLEGMMKGEKIDIRRHNLRTDVKAVTYHNLQIKKERGFYTAIIVLDI
jgi:SHS2 domain-containing protein